MRDYVYVVDCAAVVAGAGVAATGLTVKVIASQRAMSIGLVLGEFRRVLRRDPRISLPGIPAGRHQSSIPAAVVVARSSTPPSTPRSPSGCTRRTRPPVQVRSAAVSCWAAMMAMLTVIAIGGPRSGLAARAVRPVAAARIRYRRPRTGIDTARQDGPSPRCLCTEAGWWEEERARPSPRPVAEMTSAGRTHSPIWGCGRGRLLATPELGPRRVNVDSHIWDELAG